MSALLLRNEDQNRVLGRRVERAGSFHRRLLGLMFRSGLAEGEGLWIEPCNAVHTHFMRFPIDVLFLDGEGRVVHIIPAMAPWRFSPLVRDAVAVVELAAGTAAGTAVGDRLILVEE